MKPCTLLAVALSLLAAGHAFSVPDWQPKKKQAPDDRKLIQGTWTATCWEADAQKIQGTLHLVVKGRQWVLTINNKEVIKGRIKIEPARKVKTFDATVTEGTGKGITVEGIYRLENEMWTLCWSVPNGRDSRPTEFETKSTSGCFLFILKRTSRRT